MKLQFVDGRVEVWDDEATVVNEGVDDDGVDWVEYVGGWMEPNEYQAGIIRDTLISALQNMQCLYWPQTKENQDGQD